MAQRLQERYDRQSRAAPLPSDLLLHRWTEVQSQLRQVRTSVVRRWTIAEARSRQRLREAIRQLSHELTWLETALNAAAPSTPTPTLRLLYEELRSLYDEFEDVSIDAKFDEIAVRTERIVLDEVDFGPFEIRLGPRFLTEHRAYRVIALEPYPSASNDSVSHPHVQSESLCEGEGKHTIECALADGRFGDFFVTVRQILRTYNEDSAYVSLEAWSGSPCVECGDTILSDEEASCRECGVGMCDSCCRSCSRCEASLCGDCTGCCEECDHHCCDHCLSPCPTCHRSLCSSCFDENLNENCPDCLDPQPEDDDAQSQDTSTLPSPSPSTAPETSPTYPKTDSAVQPDRVGEALVPA